MTETRYEALDRLAQDLDPGALFELVRFLSIAVQAIEDGNKDEALDRITRVMAGIAMFHTLVFLEVPDWCQPQTREYLEKMLSELRRDIDILKRLRESGGDPPVPPPPRRLMN